MGIQYSTGKKTRFKHLTSTEFEELDKRKKAYPTINTSTGADSAIRHVTGIEFDLRQFEEEEALKEELQQEQ